MTGDKQSNAVQLQRQVFLDALEKTDAREREAFLQEACGNSPQFRQRVEDLLREHESVGSFLEQPVWRRADNEHQPHLATVASLIEQPGDYIGPYKLVHKLGEGGCGVVYLAQQEQPLRREVALKIIRLGMDTQQVITRFETERQTLALMDHPNIAKVFDAGATQTGRPFFVMELVRGIKLTEHCNRNQLPIRERLQLFVQVCQGIQHAHQKGIIHRDIKPSNILVAQHDGKAVPKIIDFGIAKAIYRQRTADQTEIIGSGLLIGTPAYMSPEQAGMGGMDVDTRSDIYSLGVLLYELLTGTTPFDTEELINPGLEKMRQIVRERQPPKPSTRLSQDLPANAQVSSQSKIKNHKSKIGEDLDWIVMKALDKDRTRRYGSATAFAQDIVYYLADEPVLARPPSNLYRFQKMVWRHRTPFAALAAVAGVLVLATGISAWLAARATHAETQARISEKMEAKLKRQAEVERERAEAQADLANQNEYVADINLAQQSLESGNYGRAIQLLKRHWPLPSRPDLRGFEWRYLWQLSRGDDHLPFPAQGSSVRSLVAGPTGRWLAVGTDNSLNLWDLSSRTLARTFHERFVSTAFSADGRELLLSNPSEVRIIDLGTWAETTLPDQDGGVVAVSRDGLRVAIAGRDGVRLWDAKAWTSHTLLPGGSAPLAFSPDGQFLAICTRVGVAVWNLSTVTEKLVLRNSQQLFRPRFRDQLGKALTFSADGSYLMAPRNAFDGGVFAITVWDAQSGEEVGSVPEDPADTEHTGTIAWLALSPDGRTLATASMDHSIRLWDLPSRRALNVLHGHLSEVWALTFSTDGKALFSGAKDGSVNLWSIPPGPKQDLLEGPFVPLAFSQDGRRLAILDQQASVVLLVDALTRQTNGQFQLERGPFRGPPATVALSADLQVLAQGTRNGVKLFNINNKQIVELDTGDAPVFELALSPDGRQLITGGFRQPTRWWDVATGTNIDFGMGVRRALFSPNGSSLLLLSNENRAELWNVATRSLQVTLAAETALGPAAAFSPNGQMVAVASDPLNPEQMINLWDASTGHSLGTCVGHKQGISALVFSGDGRTLASASHDSTLKLWNVATLQQLLSFAMPGGANNPLFSPDGTLLVVGQSLQQKGVRFFSAPQPKEREQLTVEPAALP